MLRTLLRIVNTYCRSIAKKSMRIQYVIIILVIHANKMVKLKNEADCNFRES